MYRLALHYALIHSVSLLLCDSPHLFYLLYCFMEYKFSSHPAFYLTWCNMLVVPHTYTGSCVNQHCISLYVLYSARNVFKIIIGCDCYPLLVLRLPNDFLFHSEPKMACWDPLHQYWTTNSILEVDVNMGGWKWGG